MSSHPLEEDVLADLTDDEMTEVDRFMSEHMYHHQISNSYAGMSCDAWCRTRALGEAFRRHVLVPRREARTAVQSEPTGCLTCDQGLTVPGHRGHAIRPTKDES